MSSARADLDALARECYAAVVSDCCDAIGLRHQALDADIRPAVLAGSLLVGWARPVRAIAVDENPDEPYVHEIDFIDSLEQDQVVMARCEAPNAFWGELFSMAARARGARGAVVDGFVRDQARIPRADGFGVFARGGRPTDCLGRSSVVESDAPIVIGGVEVALGDLVVADVDGVVVVPRRAASEVMERALAKARKEDGSRALLLAGATLRQAWERFGVL
jgi:4-hydroxy-4-methyl-2-oxoglutarate aldolase